MKVVYNQETRRFSKDNELKDYAVVYLKINPDYEGVDKGDLEASHDVVKNSEAEVGNFIPKSTKAYIIDRVIKKNLTHEDARQLVEANKAQYPRKFSDESQSSLAYHIEIIEGNKVIHRFASTERGLRRILSEYKNNLDKYDIHVFEIPADDYSEYVSLIHKLESEGHSSELIDKINKIGKEIDEEKYM